MARINVLPKEIYQLIAAGEVVERPSSVVKEMIENSLDAGAKNITIEIKNGGSTYIRITDDGCGIERDDVRKVFISHATAWLSVQRLYLRNLRQIQLLLSLRLKTRLKMKVKATFNIILPLKALMRYLKYLRQLI